MGKVILILIIFFMTGSCCHEEKQIKWKSYESPDDDKRLPRVNSHYPKVKIDLDQAEKK